MTTLPLIDTSPAFDAEMRRMADAAIWNDGFAAGLDWASRVIAAQVGTDIPPLTPNPFKEQK